jgi:hypothetical protein
MTKEEARKLAQIEIAERARRDGESIFAQEVLSGAWDETNRSDIAGVMNRLLDADTPEAIFAAVVLGRKVVT